jgi:hypothetical protein
VETPTYLFVQLDKVGLKSLLEVSTSVVLEGALTVTHACCGLFSLEVCIYGSGQRVEWHGEIVGILILRLFSVRNFLVRDQGRVVSGHVTG